MSAPLFLVAVAVVICAYLGVFIYTGAQKPPPEPNLGFYDDHQGGREIDEYQQSPLEAAAGLGVIGKMLQVERQGLIREAREGTEGNSLPKIEIDDSVPNVEFFYCIRVTSAASKLMTHCLAKVVSVTSDEGQELDRIMVLYTGKQTEGRPQGNFNLRPEEPKLIIFASPFYKDGGGVELRGADGQTQRLLGGKYVAVVKIFTDEGVPAECKLLIEGASCKMMEIFDAKGRRERPFQ